MLAPTIPRHRTLLLSALLVVLSVLAYWPVRHNGFVNYDDPLYVTANPTVQDGITLRGIAWAFTQVNAANYHPVTWLSHMLDCQLFGTSAAAHHAVSVLLHAVNSVLVLLVFQRMTGRAGASVVVGCLFAVHPAHVESVAWVAERKDVLSGTFFLLTIAAYLRYVERPGAGRYALVLGMFALGLLSKAMLVTVPCVLLLLDHWPLKRPAPLKALILEKLPIFGLVALVCVATFIAQRESGAMDGGTMQSTLGERSANAAVSYVRYLGTFAWPADLAVFYPRQSWAAWQVAAATCVLVALSCLAVALRERRPYLLVGWLWFLGMLVPVIGLIQVGSQSMADRYLYLPMIGLAVVVVWAAADVLGERLSRSAGAVCAALVIVLCMVATQRYTKVWADDQTLYSHCLRVTPDNPFARQNLAAALAAKGHVEGAIVHYRRAVELQPDLSDGRGGLGYALRLAGRFDEAEAELRVGLAIDPKDARLHAQLGLVYLDQRRWAEASTCFEHALQRDPANEEAAYHLAVVRHTIGDAAGAVAMLRRAVGINPFNPRAHYLLGALLVQGGRSGEAVEHLARAVRLAPNYGEAHLKLAIALAGCGRSREAVGPLVRAVQLNPDSPDALQGLAWILATHPDGGVRNGAEAVVLAARAEQLTGSRSPDALDALAAALAESGQYQAAAETAEKAARIVRAAGGAAHAAQIEARAAGYRNRSAFRDPSLASVDLAQP